MTLIWIIAGIMIAVFLFGFLVPYMKGKITLWYLAYKFRKMAKKHKGELKNDLMDLSEKVKELADSEKL